MTLAKRNFNHKGFWATQAALLTVMLASNLMNLFSSQNVLKSRPREWIKELWNKLKTFKPRGINAYIFSVKFSKGKSELIRQITNPHLRKLKNHGYQYPNRRIYDGQGPHFGSN